MPNPFHYRTVVNRLWRIATGPQPGYIRLRALDKLAPDFTPGHPRFAIAQQMLRDVDPYEYAPHLLRDLYDRAEPTAPASEASPAPARGPVPLDDELPEDDDDPW